MGWGFGHTLGMVAIIAEFTKPFVNNRWFLDKVRLSIDTERAFLSI